MLLQIRTYVDSISQFRRSVSVHDSENVDELLCARVSLLVISDELSHQSLGSEVNKEGKSKRAIAQLLYILCTISTHYS